MIIYESIYNKLLLESLIQEQNLNLIEEGLQERYLAIGLASAIGFASLFPPGKFNNTVKNSKVALEKLIKNPAKVKAVNVNKFKEILKRYESLSLNNNFSEDYKEVNLDFLMQNPEVIPRKENIKEVLENFKEISEFYNLFKDNSYLKSILVTYIFSTSKSLHNTLSPQKRNIKLSANKRNVLFYMSVVGKKPKSQKKLNKREMRENINHPMWDKYSRIINKIIENLDGEKYFTVWLNPQLADYFNKSHLEESFWCGAFIASLLTEVIFRNNELNKKEIEDNPYFLLQGNYFASTKRLYENFKNKEDLVFARKDLKEKIKNKEILDAIAKLHIRVGSIITVEGRGIDEGGHFAIVTNKSEDSFDVLEGNMGNNEISYGNYSYESVSIVLNLRYLFNTNEKELKTVQKIISNMIFVN